MSDLVKQQAPPIDNGGPDVWLLVINDMMQRRVHGIEKYGAPVRPNNGRDQLIDAFQEALDLVVYLRAAIEERSIERNKVRNSPTKVCLVGSSRFKAEHERAMREETLAGKIVLPMGLYGHLEALDMHGPVKKKLDELHFRKIDESDEILVINVGGYIGESTCREIDYAVKMGKRVRYLEPRNTCHAAKDGDCTCPDCPQERDSEPSRSGRNCPLDHTPYEED
jgi:hypothetical protein